MATATLSTVQLAPGQAAWRRFRRHRLALAGAVIILVLVLGAAFGPYLLPFDDTYIDIMKRFAPPLSGAHILGTDELGRDVLARLMMGGRVSLSIGIVAMVIAMAVGIAVGAFAGFYGGVVGAVLMRLVDAVLCFPTIFLLLALAALTEPGLVTTTVLIAATAWMAVARVVEAQVRSLREREFAVAALAFGSSNLRIMFRELVPNAIAPIVVAATLNVAKAILLESYVSYLGYGIQPPAASWGNMLNNAQIYLTSAPWLAIAPGLAITLAVTSFNFLGDGLRDALDPRVDAAPQPQRLPDKRDFARIAPHLAAPAPVAARLLAGDDTLLDERDIDAALSELERGGGTDDAAADDRDGGSGWKIGVGGDRDGKRHAPDIANEPARTMIRPRESAGLDSLLRADYPRLK
jgi:peptide/nickel transport system permease protein